MTRKRAALVVASGGILMVAAVAIGYMSWASGESAVAPRSGGAEGATRAVWKGAASWSPDGKSIAIVRGPVNICGGDIYIVNTRGEKKKRITWLADSEHKTGPASPAWSPDGKTIAFTVTVPFLGGCIDEELDVIRAAGGRRTTLRKGPFAFAVDGACHSWSPDGRWILFAESDDRSPFERVVVVKPDGTKRRRVARASLGAGCPVWSRDSRRIAFVRGKGQDSVGLGDVVGEVYVVDLDGNEQRLSRTHSGAWSPTWAADSSRIAFITDDGEKEYHSSIRTVRPDGTAQTRIAVESDTLLLDGLTWSPDGRWIAYDRSVISGASQLVVISADGSRRRVLASGCCASWSPDGKRLLVAHGSGGLYIAREDQIGLPGKLRPFPKR
ncbi:MAG TPA: hypothetical protein VLA89_08450 [Gemmatimonadales bacterium]|nr:hypothetical protein [Gemmatimonadales bacterium]